MDTPRIYVASLSDYNAGILHGVWIDLDDGDNDRVWQEIRDMLAESPEFRQFPQGGPAEEWAIHDYECFGNLKVSEYDSIDWLVAVGAGIEEHGAAFAAWAEMVDDRYSSDSRISGLDDFQDAYRGQYDSMADFAEELADDLGMQRAIDGLEKEIGSMAHYVSFDAEAFARDLSMGDYDFVEAPNYGGYFVFDPHI